MNKLKKLTASLKQSEDYQLKIRKQVDELAEDLSKNKIKLAKTINNIEKTHRFQQQIDGVIIKLKQESTRHKYKMDKLQLKENEMKRKIKIEQQIQAKKDDFKSQLLTKINKLEKDCDNNFEIDKECEKVKNQMQELEKQSQKLMLKIEKLYNQSLSMKKNQRLKQDEVDRLRKKNQNKRKYLRSLEDKIIYKSSDDKENLGFNLNQCSPNKKINRLNRKKQQIDLQIQTKSDGLNEIFSILDSLQLQNQLARQITAQDQQLSQIKLKKQRMDKFTKLSASNFYPQKTQSRIL